MIRLLFGAVIGALAMQFYMEGGGLLPWRAADLRKSAEDATVPAARALAKATGSESIETLAVRLSGSSAAE